MKKILVLHGPNLNKLGKRDVNHYGHLTLDTIVNLTQLEAQRHGADIIAYQSNHEGDLIDKIQTATPDCIGIIINPGALTHYSYALHDALLDAQLPAIEVHLSKISEREDWRKISVTAPACVAVIEGKKIAGYQEAVQQLLHIIKPASLSKSRPKTTPPTKLNLVIGNPLSHSKSPLLHNAAYSLLGLNAHLKPLAYPSLEPLIQTIKALHVELTAVTMPFKSDVIKHLDALDEEVISLNAANTIIQKNGRLYGYNTDVNGIEYAFKEISLACKKALIIGAGGAATAACHVMKKSGADLLFFNRSLERAESLSQQFGGTVLDSSHFSKLESLPIDIIIQTTPIGMYPNSEETPLPSYSFKPHQIVFDVVYNPVETKLLQQAKQKGAKVISGIDMFLGQAIRQIELWTGESLIQQRALIETLKSLLIQEDITP